MLILVSQKKKNNTISNCYYYSYHNDRKNKIIILPITFVSVPLCYEVFINCNIYIMYAIHPCLKYIIVNFERWKLLTDSILWLCHWYRLRKVLFNNNIWKDMRLFFIFFFLINLNVKSVILYRFDRACT